MNPQLTDLLQAALTATKLHKTDIAKRYLTMIMSESGMKASQADAQTALMGNLFAEKNYKEVIRIFRSGTAETSEEKEAARLMFAARSYMRLKQPQEALGLFRDVERLLKPQPTPSRP